MKSASSKPKVLFYSLRHAYIKEQSCLFDGANGRLIEEIQKHFPDDFTLVVYQDQRPRAYFSMELKPQKLKVLPFHNSFSNGIRYMWQVIKTLKRLEKEVDVLIIQLPLKSYLLPFFLKKPIIYHICSNLQTAALNPVKYKGIRKAFAYGYATLMHYINHLMLSKRNAHLIANGSELGSLYQQYKTKVVVSASIYEKEIIHPNELKKRNESFQFLFVGRPSLEKGFDTLLSAFKIVKDQHPSIKLKCVGFDQTAYRELWKADDFSDLESHIEFFGEIPFSDALFDIYKSSDALILPSRSEGTPRVLVEARAFGCPVIASNIGGIPTSIKNEFDGLLFEAGDANELAEKMVILITKESFRHTLQVNGLETVKEMTMEKFSHTFLESINKLFLNGQ